jgi:uncharacterized glyoxalase superfamily protein PhnB
MTKLPMGPASVVPELVYQDVGEAIEWLRDTFGFEELWRIENHRARLQYGNGVIVVTDATNGRTTPGEAFTHGVMVHVTDVDAHYENATRQGAKVHGPPKTYGYGERQYGVTDPAGHVWTFSQTVATGG